MLQMPQIPNPRYSNFWNLSNEGSRSKVADGQVSAQLDNLLTQNNRLINEVEGLRRELEKCRRERDAAVTEAQQFREDVRFLTRETETMLMELKEENEAKVRVERELHKAERALEDMQHAPKV